MPLYEYKCHQCGQTVEVLQKFSDEPLRTHEGCGGDMEKLISSSAFHLKGSGWYVTDYGKSNKELKPADKKSDEKSSDSKPAESGASTSSESKNEAKPAATESKPSAPAGDTKS